MAILFGKGKLVSAIPKVGYEAIIPSLKSPTEFIKASMETPTFGAGGTAATVFKSITKQSGMKLLPTLIVGGGALVAGSLLSGGGKQEQKQTAAQDLKQQQEQKLAAALKATLGKYRAEAKLKAEAEQVVDIAPIITPTVTPTYDVTAGGDVDIGGVTTTTRTATTNISEISQGLTAAQVGQLLESRQEAAQVAIQMPAISQTQEAKQEGGINWGIIAIAAAAIAYFVFKGKKNYAR